MAGVMMARVSAAAVMVGLALAAPLMLAGCAAARSAAATPVQSAATAAAAEAAAWMAQHPAAERPGWVDAMILPGGWADVGFIGAAAREACPSMYKDGNGDNPQTEALIVGNLPGCGAWTATALTDTGQVVSLACGSIPARAECPLFLYADGYIPSGGDYVRIRSADLPGGGQITGWDSIQVIQEFADMAPILMEPDPGGPVWATTPAGGA
jgi:hypothetical protein